MAPVQLRSLSPAVPETDSEMNELIEDLTRMRCQGLLARPWLLKDEEMVRELVDGPDNRWDNSIRGHPTQWTTDMWAETYDFIQEGYGWATRTDKYVQDRFTGKIHRNNGYEIDACKDRRERQVLAFLIPILYPLKPEQVTITVGNTIFGAFTGERPVNWAQIISDTVQKLLAGVGRKAVPITPFLYHLYHTNGLLLDEEECDYAVAKDLLFFKEAPEGVEEPQQEGTDTTTTDDQEPDVELLPEPVPARAHSKSRSERATSQHAEPSTARDGSTRKATSSERGFPDDPFRSLREGTRDAQATYERIEAMLRRVCTSLGGCEPEEALREIELLKDAPQLRAEKQQLELQVRELTSELAVKSEEIRKFHAEQEQTLNEIRKLVGVPGDVVNKARLFDENVMTSAGGPDSQKIITIMAKYEFTMSKTLKLMKKLLCPESGSQSVGPRMPGSPSRSGARETREVVFKTPRERTQSPGTESEQVRDPDPIMFGPTRTIARLIAEAVSEETSPGVIALQPRGVVAVSPVEPTGTTVTTRRSEERTVMEEVVRTVQPIVVPTVEEEGTPTHQVEVAGSQWRRSISPPGSTRAVPGAVLTPSPTARTETVTPTPAGTPAETPPAGPSGHQRQLRKRKGAVKPGPINLSESDSDSTESSPSGTIGTDTRTPTSETPTPRGTPPKTPKSPKTRITTRSVEVKSKEKAASGAKARGSEPRATRSKDSNKRTKTQ